MIETAPRCTCVYGSDASVIPFSNTMDRDVRRSLDALPDKAILHIIWLRDRSLFSYSPKIQQAVVILFRKHGYVEIPTYDLDSHSCRCNEDTLYFRRINWSELAMDTKCTILSFNFTGSSMYRHNVLGLTKRRFASLNGTCCYVPENVSSDGASLLFPEHASQPPHDALIFGRALSSTYQQFTYRLENTYCREYRVKCLKHRANFSEEPMRTEEDIVQHIRQNADVPDRCELKITDEHLEILQRTRHFNNIKFNYVESRVHPLMAHLDTPNGYLYPIKVKPNDATLLRIQHFTPNLILWYRNLHISDKRRQMFHATTEFEVVEDTDADIPKTKTRTPKYWPLPGTPFKGDGWEFTGRVKFRRVWQYEIAHRDHPEQRYITEGRVSWPQHGRGSPGDNLFLSNRQHRPTHTQKRKRAVDCSDIFLSAYKKVRKAMNSKPKNGITLGPMDWWARVQVSQLVVL